VALLCDVWLFCVTCGSFVQCGSCVTCGSFVGRVALVCDVWLFCVTCGSFVGRAALVGRVTLLIDVWLLCAVRRLWDVWLLCDVCLPYTCLCINVEQKIRGNCGCDIAACTVKARGCAQLLYLTNVFTSR